MSHPVVFAEIHGADGAALRRFYAGLFGWPFQEMPGAATLSRRNNERKLRAE